jgi:hypothetical protein
MIVEETLARAPSRAVELTAAQAGMPAPHGLMILCDFTKFSEGAFSERKSIQTSG